MPPARPAPATRTRPGQPGAAGGRWPHRHALVIGECAVVLAGAAGSVMLLADRFTPPLEAIAPLGLTSWAVPGLWLAVTVPVPAGLAAVLAWRRSVHAPEVVLAANAAMAVEVLVQIPFLGPSPLQAVVGGTAVALAVLARRARRARWGDVEDGTGTSTGTGTGTGTGTDPAHQASTGGRPPAARPAT